MADSKQSYIHWNGISVPSQHHFRSLHLRAHTTEARKGGKYPPPQTLALGCRMASANI
jgi:hypothetical protein